MTSRHARQDGAAAVEFALVSTVFFLFLFGIIQYGLFFSDSLSNRQGAREGARQAVVGNFTSAYSGCNAETANTYRMIKCNTRYAISPLAGTSNAYVKLTLKKKGANAAATWTKGNALLVCSAVRNNGFLGLLPMPNNGWTLTSTEMSIEQDGVVPTGTVGDVSDTYSSLPASMTWNWCT